MSDKRRLLNDLRVIDLRAELEKRNLDKSGVRGVLIQRLSKHIEEEGHDPATFKFELVNSDAKTPSKKTRRSESTFEQEAEETPAMEDMIVQDDVGDDDDIDPKDTEGEKNAEAKMEVDDNKSNTRKREIKDEPEASEPKKACLDKEDDQKTDNNDAEDSINLDLGEDELLNEETDSTTKPSKKDDAANGEADETCEDGGADADADADEDADAAPGDDDDDDAAPPDDQEANAEVPATSNDADENEKDQKDEKEECDKKDKKDEGKEGGARNLWVSGLSGDTRAKDLKQLCSKHGKVIGAKVVTNARTPGSRCYGYVTMASSQDAENCIKNLHRTELHGRMISVEKAKSESESSSRRQPSRSEHHSNKDVKDESKDKEEDKDGAEKICDGKPTESGAERARSTSRTREKSTRSDKDRIKRSTRSRERRRSPPAPARDVLSFNKIWKERDVARARERSRAAREEERRRRAAEEALRERERRQRQEKHRLALEREKLRAEREKIEREKNELLRLERERHRLEREKLELERMELKRAQIRLEEERRKRGYESNTYRKAASPPPDPGYERDTRHKRQPPPPIVSAVRSRRNYKSKERSSSRAQFEAPPPPRFEMGSNYDRNADKPRDRGTERDYKRSEYPRHVSSSNMKYSSNGADDARQPMPPGTRPKEPSRTYDSRDTRSYRPSPPSKPEPRSWNASSRYPDSSAPSKVVRAGSSSNAGGEAWSSGGGEARYAGYDTRYPPQYQPPPPGATYPDRYAQPARDSYTRKY